MSFLHLTADHWEDEIDRQCNESDKNMIFYASLCTAIISFPLSCFEPTKYLGFAFSGSCLVALVLNLNDIRLPTGRRRGIMSSLGISPELLQSVRENRKALIQNDHATTALEEALEAQQIVETNLDRNIAELQDVIIPSDTDFSFSPTVELFCRQRQFRIVQTELSEIKKQLVALKRRRRSLVDHQLEFEVTRTRQLAAKRTRDAAKLDEDLEVFNLEQTGSLVSREFCEIEKNE